MLKRIVLTGIFALFCANIAFASSVFDFPIKSQNIENQLPPLNNVSCKFTQEKTFNNTKLLSGGNFKFEKEKGVFFETLYPVQSSVSYTKDTNSKINSIMMAIANKNYAALDKNFNLYLQKTGEIWTLAFKPKQNTPIAQQLESIIINGNKYINQIGINSLNGSKTNINFECD